MIIEFNICAQFLLDLLNSLEKMIRCVAKHHILSFCSKLFNKFNTKRILHDCSCFIEFIKQVEEKR